MNSTSLSCSVSVLLYLYCNCSSTIRAGLVRGVTQTTSLGLNVLKMGCDQGQLR